MNYILLGAPTPLARARHGNGRTYDSQKKIKLAIGLDLMVQHEQRPIIDCPFRLEIDFYFKPASSLSEKKKLLQYGQFHYFKPDLSNLIKFVEDIGTGIIWRDDCQISQIIANKRYDDIERTEFRVIEL